MIFINYWAVIVAAVLVIIFGFLWYGPLFGKTWRHLMGIHEHAEGMKKSMGSKYAVMTVATFLMSYVLAHTIVLNWPYFVLANRYFIGLAIPFGIWAGFIVPVTLNSVLWEGRSWKLWWINSGYYLVSLIIMAMVFTMWA